jgi:hypothetical protein
MTRGRTTLKGRTTKREVPDESGNYKNVEGVVAQFIGLLPLSLRVPIYRAEAICSGIPRLRLEQFPLTMFAGLYMIPVEG